ncbi:MAG: ATP-binding cassette domain-containing protein [Lachnospiraceae bacterium]|nr:ATP-binding cassette domain-containing protein [Lachnospiraceae bacterium]
MARGDLILDVQKVHKRFASKGVVVKAVTDVSFTVNEGETIGIVGESGCGKTTLGRCIVRAYSASEGKVMYTTAEGKVVDFLKVDKKEMKKIRKEIQMIFQDPYSSLDPRMTVLDIIKEPLKANFPDMSNDEMNERCKDIAAKVGLNVAYLNRYPHAFSGGQRQRIGIARALVLNPRIIVCDEAVSALDVSVQAQVINLLNDLKKEFGLTYLFISHDLSVVEHISDKVGVMYLGRMVEYSKTEELFEKPMHPYTEALLSAVPVADPDYQMDRIPLQGEIPNPANPPKGCYFHERCRYCKKGLCDVEAPELKETPDGRLCACHRALELNLRGFKYEEGAKDKQKTE